MEMGNNGADSCAFVPLLRYISFLVSCIGLDVLIIVATRLLVTRDSDERFLDCSC